MSTPLVSLIIPAYNQAQYLAATLQSVFDQSHTHWECIIVNDGSTDQTAQIAASWVHKDPRFQCVHQENQGLSAARNAGLQKAQGDWIQFLDADDLLHPDKLSASLEAATTQGAAVCITDFKRFTNNIHKLKKAYCNLSEVDFSFDSFLLEWDLRFTVPIHCALFAQKSIEGITFSTQVKAKEDWFFWLEVYLSHPKTAFIARPLAYYRMHPSSMTRDITHMNANFIAVHERIYEWLPAAYKPVFVRRLAQHVVHERNCIHQLRNKRMSTRIKNWLKK